MSSQRMLLVVEDNAMYAEVLCALMSLVGWSATACGSMATAFDSLGRRRVEVTLLDLMLPDSTSEASLAQINALKHAGAGRVVVVTAVPVTPDFTDLATKSGAFATLSKSDDHFERRLSDIVGRPA